MIVRFLIRLDRRNESPFESECLVVVFAASADAAETAAADVLREEERTSFFESCIKDCVTIESLLFTVVSDDDDDNGSSCSNLTVENRELQVVAVIAVAVLDVELEAMVSLLDDEDEE